MNESRKIVLRFDFPGLWSMRSPVMAAGGRQPPCLRDPLGLPYIPAEEFSGLLPGWAFDETFPSVTAYGAYVDNPIRDLLRSMRPQLRRLVASEFFDRVQGMDGNSTGDIEMARPMVLFASLLLGASSGEEDQVISQVNDVLDHVAYLQALTDEDVDNSLDHHDGTWSSVMLPEVQREKLHTILQQGCSLVIDSILHIADLKMSMEQSESKDPTRSISPGERSRLSVIFDLQSPVLITRHQRGSQIEAWDYIPGSEVIRLIRDIVRSRGIDDTAVERDGGIVASHAYPVINGKAALPVPFCLSTPKSANSGEVLVFNNIDDQRVGQPSEQLRSGWIVPGENCLISGTTSMVTQRMDSATISGEELLRGVDETHNGGIASGQLFEAKVEISSALIEAVRTVDRWQVGETSNNEELGSVRLAWRHDGYTEIPDHFDPELRLWCTSDVIPESEDFSLLGSLRRDFARMLGCPVDDLLIDLSRTRIRSVRFDGLDILGDHLSPSRSRVAIAKGSVIVVRTRDATQSSLLGQILIREGVGQLRREGFGRIQPDHTIIQAGTTLLRTSSVDSSSDRAIDVTAIRSSPNFGVLKGALEGAYLNLSATHAYALGASAVASEELSVRIPWVRQSASDLSRFLTIFSHLPTTGPAIDQDGLNYVFKHWKSVQRRTAMELISDYSVIWDLLANRLSADEMYFDMLLDGHRETVWRNTVSALISGARDGHSVFAS